jgi:hypothetical protein
VDASELLRFASEQAYGVGEGLVFDFDGVDREQYDAVNARLGLDPESEEGDSPACLRFQASAAKPAAGVFEVRETPSAQEQFKHERVEQAIQQNRDCRVGTRRAAESDLRRRAWHWRGRSRVKPRRSFDPQRVGQLECALWVAYYRREWMAFVRSAVLLIRHVFGLSWPSTARGSWFVLRATQLWAPCPDNDPVAARLAMERFYRLLKQHNHEQFDPAEAARLEIEWWGVHRQLQHSKAASDDRTLVDALAALYSYAFGVPDAAVRPSAEHHALAIRHCDQWVQAGCDVESSLIAQQRAALVRSHAGLLAAVHQP